MLIQNKCGRVPISLTAMWPRFMPNIGKYMLNVLNGNSNGPEKDKAWSWKSERELKAARSVVVKELRDFVPDVSTSRL